MTNILRFVQVFAIGTWVGSILYFAFVVAQSIFSILGVTDQAGAIIGHSIAGLHHLGLVASILFLVAAVLLARSPRALLKPASLLVILMLLMAGASQHIVIPRMEALRRQMGSVVNTPHSNPLWVEFDRLHGVSVDLEMATLLAGLVALYLTARKEQP
ncbi:MAG TPA: DUF4149 domain-containing protein [Verrucomicrobiae bacterium]|nr:DUF4149 domain-containing protein [Verrucomicrobiae bacterium]